jgi:hypothetical protein
VTQQHGQESLRHGSLGFQVGEFGLFGDIGEAFEFYAVAVGVVEVSDPHVVANEGFAGREPFGHVIVIQG